VDPSQKTLPAKFYCIRPAQRGLFSATDFTRACARIDSARLKAAATKLGNSQAVVHAVLPVVHNWKENQTTQAEAIANKNFRVSKAICGFPEEIRRESVCVWLERIDGLLSSSQRVVVFTVIRPHSLQCRRIF
jgi:hypothetical protein